MLTVKQALCHQRLKKIIFIGGALLLIVLTIKAMPTVRFLHQKIIPPNLPALQSQGLERIKLDQGWDSSIADKYHHTTQGTRTMPIPYSWFKALEKPTDSALGWLLFSEKLFTDNEYLLRFGFIEGHKTELNPDGLPIGFALMDFQNLPGVDGQHQAVGFTCAACHTGHFTYQQREYLVEGGPASTALDLFNQSISSALLQTVLSAKLPLLNGRFERFSKAVLKEQYNTSNVQDLKTQLFSAAETLAAQPSHVAVTEGFSRLDALNRIGNQVFAIDVQRPENYVAPNAPVNYPHIWTSSWFNWVQYDGSIMQPLVRNAGEALGVRARQAINRSTIPTTISSTINIDNIVWMEDMLSGVQHPLSAKKFSGLQAPKWPESLGRIDGGLADKGKALYARHCQRCHLPPINSDKIFDDRYWQALTLDTGLVAEKTLQLKKIAIEQVGTDAQQASILLKRHVNTAKTDSAPAMGLNASVCTPKSDSGQSLSNYSSKKSHSSSLMQVQVVDQPMLPFALALGAIVEQNINSWNQFKNLDEKTLWRIKGQRPNCLAANLAYKARPLNGVWATAPFLHNGAIAHLYDLLSPVDQRPRFVKLGSLAFDNTKVGLLQDPQYAQHPPTLNRQGFDAEGFFWLDSQISGNSNKGHEFSQQYRRDKPLKGVIGPELSDDERFALIEYLKTL